MSFGGRSTTVLESERQNDGGNNRELLHGCLRIVDDRHRAVFHDFFHIRRRDREKRATSDSLPVLFRTLERWDLAASGFTITGKKVWAGNGDPETSRLCISVAHSELRRCGGYDPGRCGGYESGRSGFAE
jgi:hypothetical protein